MLNLVGDQDSELRLVRHYNPYVSISSDVTTKKIVVKETQFQKDQYDYALIDSRGNQRWKKILKFSYKTCGAYDSFATLDGVRIW